VTAARIPGLDGMRGLAILLVLVSHGLGLTGAGLAGVLLFFVLSGYLITSLLMGEFERTGRISLGQFYLRRAVRLVPALVVFLALLFLVSLYPGSGTSPADTARGALYGLTYTTDLVVGLGLDLVPVTEHLWTLAVEEQFYVLWPLTVLVLLAKVAREHRLRVVVWLYAAAVLVRLTTVLVSLATGWFFYVLPTTWGDALLAGCLLAVVARERPDLLARLRGPAMSWWTAAFSALVLGGFSVHPASYWSPVTYVALIPVLSAIGCQLVLAATAPSPPPWSVALAARPARWLGDHSYALYLYNSAAILVAVAALGRTPLTIAVALAAAIALSVLSRVAVERPAAAWRRRHSPHPLSQPQGLASRLSSTPP
jgi:peptidoglycan/LPS O-acetylase OafA/YrhL